MFDALRRAESERRRKTATAEGPAAPALERVEIPRAEAFAARVAHSVTYLAGWPFIRPVFWFAGVIGCALIYLAVFGILV